MAYVQSLCAIIDFLYDEIRTQKQYIDHFKKLKDSDPDHLAKYSGVMQNPNYDDVMKLVYEGMFAYAMIWSFGAALSDSSDRSWFNGTLRNKAGKIKFPEIQNSQVYDFRFDVTTATWESWYEGMEKMDPDYDGLYSNLIVPTIETTRQNRLINIHKYSKKGIFYAGIAGTGKTTVLKNYFQCMNKEENIGASVNFNSYTDSLAFQQVLESNVQKRYGRLWGPPPSKKLIFFIDDINMPKVDTYGTQQPIALCRQIIDYKMVYDRNALSEQKILEDVMFMASMNPKSGSFFVDLRLQRHFTTVALILPDKEALKAMYKQILDSHFVNFDQVCRDTVPCIVDATAAVFTNITMDKTLLPTATKFHYQFNLRDFSKIIQTFLLTDAKIMRGNKLGLARLWLHECHRVWRDRLIRAEDEAKYMQYINTGLSQFQLKPEDCHAEPLVFTSFVPTCKGFNDPTLMPVVSMEDLNSVLVDKLE